MKKLSKDCSILVLSCDKYADLWKPFFSQFHKHWPNCPYPLYLGSNTRIYRDPKVKTIFSGPDQDWSTSFRSILKQIRTPYIFLWLDDIFPTSDVNADDFAEALKFMKQSKGIHMHTMPTPRPDKVIANGKFGMYQPGAPYRVTALGFWRVQYLIDFLLPGENPWNFEIMGSYRSRYSDGFYCLMKPLFKRLHVVEKGQIFSEAYEYCRTHNILLDTNKRKILSDTSKIQSELQKIYFNAAIQVPWNIRLSIMNLLRKLLISY